MAGAAGAGLRGRRAGRELRLTPTKWQLINKDAVDLRTTGWGCPDSVASRSRPCVAGSEAGWPVSPDQPSGGW